MAGAIAAILAGIGSFCFAVYHLKNKTRPVMPELGWMNWIIEPPYLLAVSAFMVAAGSLGIRVALEERDTHARELKESVYQRGSRMGRYTSFLEMECEPAIQLLSATVAAKGYQVTEYTPDGSLNLRLRVPYNPDPNAFVTFTVDAFTVRDPDWNEYTVFKIEGYDGDEFRSQVADFLARDLEEIKRKGAASVNANETLQLRCKSVSDTRRTGK